MSCRFFYNKKLLIPAASEGPSSLMKATTTLKLSILLNYIQVERRGGDAISDELQAFLVEDF